MIFPLCTLFNNLLLKSKTVSAVICDWRSMAAERSLCLRSICCGTQLCLPLCPLDPHSSNICWEQVIPESWEESLWNTCFQSPEFECKSPSERCVWNVLDVWLYHIFLRHVTTQGSWLFLQFVPLEVHILSNWVKLIITCLVFLFSVYNHSLAS